MKSVKQIKSSFNGLEIPAEWKTSFQMEINTLEAQEKRNGGVLPQNNQVYASLSNLRKIYKLSANGDDDGND